MKRPPCIAAHTADNDHAMLWGNSAGIPAAGRSAGAIGRAEENDLGSQNEEEEATARSQGSFDQSEGKNAHSLYELTINRA